ncbi:MAG TPA: DUF2585 family protein [Tepidisphaeraceae bacterium]|nr:DUF2585 family protein [Tepidisphaeraceae bacterium]
MSQQEITEFPVETAQSKRFSIAYVVLIGAAIMAVAALLEHAMGRRWISASGRILLWVSAVKSSENSQQIADWYSFSHIIHGFFFYWFFRTISRRRLSVGICLLLTIGAEASWEVLENSSFIIDRYRQTMSLDYYGDSILNSMSDISFCIAGFALARFLPVWVTVALIVIMEVGVGYAIRDNLTLNIIMLIHPFSAIRQWQLGG